MTKLRRIFAAAVPVLLTGATLTQAKAQTAPAKQIFIANDEHTDYMWTADEATYRRVFGEMLDYYLDQADATQNLAAPYQSRFNCDGSLWVREYEATRSPAQFQRLIRRIRSGHISVPLNTLASTYGAQPAEAVLRGMYYAGSLERRFGLRFPMANSIENQTMPLGLASLWAGSGAQYSWRGICGCASKLPSAGQREHEIYWYTGNDGGRVLMKWQSLFRALAPDPLYGGSDPNENIGGYAEARFPDLVVDFVDQDAAFKAKYPYSVIGAFGYGWDYLDKKTDEFPRVAQAKSSAERQVVVSNEVDFFQEFLKRHTSGLPSVRASFGNEWDTYCTSMAEQSARVKRAVEKLRTAEALATLVTLRQPAFANVRAAQREQAFVNLGLYWEHDWTADGPVGRAPRAAWQRRLAQEIEDYANGLQADAQAALSAMIPKTAAQRFYAFNPLSWSRTSKADFRYDGTANIRVLDVSNGEEIPFQFVRRNSERFLRVLARDVPSVGYKVFEVQPLPNGTTPANQTPTSTVSNVPTDGSPQGPPSVSVDNGKVKIVVAPDGSISQLVDRTRSDRSFGGNINGQTINDLGGDGSQGTVSVEENGPVSTTVVATSSSPIAHTSRITLERDSGRVEIENTIDANFGDVKTWAYSFNVGTPTVRHEEVGAIATARLTTQGGSYSPRNARYDWLTLNHFADVSGTDRGVTLSNADCFFMRVGNSTTTTLDTSTPQINPLVGGQTDGEKLGIPNQGGDSKFTQRFALQTHDAFNQVTAMKFALEHQNPLVTAEVTGTSEIYPAATYSLVTVSNPNVLLWALKPAEDGRGQGITARAWNLALNAQSASISFAQPIVGAARTTHLETALGRTAVNNGAVSFSTAPQGMLTFRLLTATSGGAVASAPVNLIAQGGQNQITLSWTPASDAVSTYNVYRGTTAATSGDRLIASGLKDTTFTDTGLGAGQTFFYSVVASNFTGLSARSNRASARTQTTPAPAPTKTIFTTQTPQEPNATDNTDYELGVKFRASAAGRVTALRFFKAPGESGAHTGNLWSATGEKLAMVNFTNETASGWQVANLATPVTLAPNTTYVASVNCRSFFPVTQNALASPVTNAPLSTVADNANGVFGPSGAFPTSSYLNSNYFRDVVFAPN